MILFKHSLPKQTRTQQWTVEEKEKERSFLISNRVIQIDTPVSHVGKGRTVSRIFRLFRFFTKTTGEKTNNAWKEVVVAYFNPSKPNGNYTYRQFNIQQFYVLPHSVYLCVLYRSENKQRLFPFTALTGWSLWPRINVFTARYGLNLNSGWFVPWKV